MDNVEASVAILRKITEEWKEFSVKQSSLDALKETLKSFRNKVLPLSLSQCVVVPHFHYCSLITIFLHSRAHLIHVFITSKNYSKWILQKEVNINT